MTDFHSGNCGEEKIKCSGCSCHSSNKLDSFDWLSDIPQSREATDFVEITFKNTRKGYYRNSNGLPLQKGDVVAVEATPGHDIGTVSLVGQLVLLQMRKYKVDPMRAEMKRVYRLAKPADIEKWEEAKAREHETMLQARQIAEDLKLEMKIGDVEYQGDGNKAIFYYIADDRVDFRQLIKVLAATFKVRIEMKQIGARQEAGRIGGLGPCGRPLCCSTWLTNFVSVSTSAARYQEMSLNPQKQAGQCAKLKCCLNYELDSYLEAQKNIPSRDIPLETTLGTYYHFKTDVFGQSMQYSSDPHMAANLVTLPVERVKEIIELNKQGVKVDDLSAEDLNGKEQESGYSNVVGQDSLTRFDKKKKNKNHDRRDRNDRNDRTEARQNQQNDSDTAADAQQNDAEGRDDTQTQNENFDGRNRHDRRNNRDRRDNRDNGDDRPEFSAPENQNQPEGENANVNANDERRTRNDRRDRHQRRDFRQRDRRNGNQNDNSRNNDANQNDGNNAQ